MTTTTPEKAMQETLNLRQRLWRALMTPVGNRVPVGKNGAPHGVALLVVLVGLSLTAVVVTDLGYNEMVRYKLAVHDRDALRAKALSDSGINMAKLLLSAQGAIQPMLTALASSPFGNMMPAFTIWEIVPLQSDLMKGLTTGALASTLGLDVSGALAERETAHNEKMQDARDVFDEDAEGAGNGPFEPPKGGFGAFEGSFGVEILDEERKAVGMRGWHKASDPNLRFAYAQRFHALMAAQKYDFLFEERGPHGNIVDRAELVTNLFDWIDRDEDASDPRAEPAQWGRGGSGSEDGLYSSYAREPRNSYFDSLPEIKMVHGFTEAHWRAFSDSISIYAGEKINILSATPQTVEALMRMCAVDPQDIGLEWEQIQMRMQGWELCKSVSGPSPSSFVSYLQQPDTCISNFSVLNPTGPVPQVSALLIDKTRCEGFMTTESQNFTVRSSATVGGVTRTTTLVVRQASAGAESEYYYYTVR
ncbi:MAG: general secretion pathway protein GspK [Deltaproteobacteria bacterium]|nr:general secretion pathway protein GspK [Deltaproteobacteria bacterium]